MADHARKQIRDAVKALVTGLATTGARVEVGRTFALPANHDPYLLIYTKDEKSGGDGGTIGENPKIARMLQLVVQGRVNEASPPDDKLDQISSEVETAIGVNQRLGGLIVNMEISATKQETIAQGERHLGLVQMEFSILYRTAEGAPDAAL